MMIIFLDGCLQSLIDGVETYIFHSYVLKLPRRYKLSYGRILSRKTGVKP